MLGADWTAYKERVRAALVTDIGLLGSINESVLSNAGKQLRPIMSLLMSRACGRITRDSIDYAAASELLHNATLMHDDVADRSATRRGKPTLSASYGATVAVLVGDFWLSKAVGVIMGTAHQDEAVKLYARTLTDLASGEMLQLQKAQTADTTEEDYMRIIYCKTASLFESACRVAALSVDASGELYEAAGRYGAATGIAFQIRDDIFDYWEGSDIGKPVGIDLKEKKITLPLLGALKNAGDEAAVRKMVLEIPGKPANCGQLRRFVRENGGLEYASRRLNDYINDALEALELLEPSPEREALAALARYNAIRTQ